MRTTIELPAKLWERAKWHALTQRTDLKSIIIAALEAHLPKPKKGGR